MEADWEVANACDDKMLEMNKALLLLDDWIRDEPADSCAPGDEQQVKSSPDSSSPSSSSSSASSSLSSPAAAKPCDLQDGSKNRSSRVAFPDLKKIIVKKQVMDKAVERLGGGKQGAVMLWRLVQVWLQQQREGSGDLLLPKSAIPLAHCLSSSSFQQQQQQQQQQDPSPPPFYHHPHPPQTPIDCFSIQQQQQHNVQFKKKSNPLVAAAAPVAPPVCAKNWNSAATRAARKSRMAQQRKSFAHHHRARVSSSAAAAAFLQNLHSGNSTSSTIPQQQQQQQQQQHQHQPYAASRSSCERKNLRLLIHKDLRPSDVGNLGRIVLPKEAEVHLPLLTVREGMSLCMEDMSTSHLWQFKYRFWPNNKSRMYLLENTGDFVKYHDLQEGDSILVFKESKTGKYIIGGRKNARPPVLDINLHEDEDPGDLSDCNQQPVQLSEDKQELMELERIPSLELGDLIIEQILAGESGESDESS